MELIYVPSQFSHFFSGQQFFSILVIWYSMFFLYLCFFCFCKYCSVFRVSEKVASPSSIVLMATNSLFGNQKAKFRCKKVYIDINKKNPSPMYKSIVVWFTSKSAETESRLTIFSFPSVLLHSGCLRQDSSFIQLILWIILLLIVIH